MGSRRLRAWHNAFDPTRTAAHPLDALKSHPVSTCQVDESHHINLKDASPR
jgi:hypothetical protein